MTRGQPAVAAPTIINSYSTGTSIIDGRFGEDRACRGSRGDSVGCSWLRHGSTIPDTHAATCSNGGTVRRKRPQNHAHTHFIEFTALRIPICIVLTGEIIQKSQKDCRRFVTSWLRPAYLDSVAILFN